MFHREIQGIHTYQAIIGDYASSQLGMVDISTSICVVGQFFIKISHAFLSTTSINGESYSVSNEELLYSLFMYISVDSPQHHRVVRIGCVRHQKDRSKYCCKANKSGKSSDQHHFCIGEPVPYIQIYDFIDVRPSNAVRSWLKACPPRSNLLFSNALPPKTSYPYRKDTLRPPHQLNQNQHSQQCYTMLDESVVAW